MHLYRAIFQCYRLIKSLVRVVWLKTLQQDLDNFSFYRQALKSELTLTVIAISGNELIVVETETIAITFTFATFNGLSTAFVDFLYHNLKITER